MAVDTSAAPAIRWETHPRYTPMDRRLGFISLFIAVALAANPAHAANGAKSAEPTLAEINAQQLQLRADVEKGRGLFKDLPAAKRVEVLARQSRVIEISGGAQSVDQLDEEARIELFNSLEFIRATVAQAEGDRKVCEKSKLVGSNRYQVVCMTASEREKIRAQTREALGREVRCNLSAAACTSGGGE